MSSDLLHRLVYYSRNRMSGTPPEIAAGVDQILATSQRNNALVEVTGALIFNSGVFAQILEGPRRAVEQTFERIQRDPRHGEVLVLAFEPVTTRAFPILVDGLRGPLPRWARPVRTHRGGHWL